MLTETRARRERRAAPTVAPYRAAAVGERARALGARRRRPTRSSNLTLGGSYLRDDRRPLDAGGVERDRVERERPQASLQGDGVGARRTACGRKGRATSSAATPSTRSRISRPAAHRATRARWSQPERVGRRVERRGRVRAHVCAVALLRRDLRRATRGRRLRQRAGAQPGARGGARRAHGRRADARAREPARRHSPTRTTATARTAAARTRTRSAGSTAARRARCAAASASSATCCARASSPMRRRRPACPAGRSACRASAARCRSRTGRASTRRDVPSQCLDGSGAARRARAVGDADRSGLRRAAQLARVARLEHERPQDADQASAGWRRTTCRSPAWSTRTSPAYSKLDAGGEGDRPVFVSAASIDPASGAVSAAESRRSTEFGRVAQRVSDLRGYGGQLTFGISPDVFKFRSRYGLVRVAQLHAPVDAGGNTAASTAPASAIRARWSGRRVRTTRATWWC